MADGHYHPAEEEFLDRVAEIFDVAPGDYRAIRARFVPDAAPDPYAVLGVSPDAPLAEIRKQWRRLVRDSHPDVMQARGVPEEAVKLSEKRLIDINHAWEEISAQRAA